MVERFDFDFVDGEVPIMERSAIGDYVLYSDYAALAAENERLTREVDRKHEAYRIAHDQATENGQRAMRAEAEVERFRQERSYVVGWNDGFAHASAAASAAVKLTRTDVLREWFGGKRYARDYEYLDAQFGQAADRIISFLSARAEASAAVKVKAENIEEQAWRCDEWPEWLHKVVEQTNEIADKWDMSSEQAHAYAVLLALTTEPAAPEGRQEAARALELSGNTRELIDRMAEAIRGDTTSDDTPWATLSEDRKIGWRGDAERALAVVKHYLTARRPAEQAVTDEMVDRVLDAAGHNPTDRSRIKAAMEAER